MYKYLLQSLYIYLLFLIYILKEIIVTDDVPPPGAYDPKLDSKVKGFVIEKSERFHDNKSVASAECNVSVCTKNASNVAQTFRTVRNRN